MKIKEFKAKWKVDIRDSEIQRNLIWPENFKIELIESILNNKPIGAITLFKQDNNNFYEIIDGKQRSYAIESFWNNNLSILDKYINNFSETELEKFWNYELNIQYVSGNFKEKVELFNRINKNSKSLKPFELLRAQFYGDLILDVSNYVKNDKVVKDCLKQTDRGENEIIVLDIIRKDQDIHYFLNDNKDKSLNEFIKKPRNIFNFINDVFRNKKNIKVLIKLAEYYKDYKSDLMNNKDKLNDGIKCLENSIHVEGWNVLSSYERILDRYIVEKDDKRLFSREVKMLLWEKKDNESGDVFCKLCLNRIDCFEKAEVDHIKPWSKGGKTDISNAQLTHKYCNIKKGNR